MATPLVARRPGGQRADGRARTHYVLLNGEAGFQTEAGEGHEQADQLQLLYYVDGVSYLSDAGYDAPGFATNSTWNRYDIHNVMRLLPRFGGVTVDGGLRSPLFDASERRKRTDHMRPVERLYRETFGRVDVLTGQQGLEAWPLSGSPIGLTARVRRKVLFIQDAERPYLIDLIWGVHDSDTMSDPSGGYLLRSNYLLNTRSAPQLIDETDARGRQTRGFLLQNIRGDAALSETNSSLLIQPYRVELPPYDFTRPYGTRERNGTDATVQQLLVTSSDPRLEGEASGELYPDYQMMATVAFIEAFPDENNPRSGTLTDLAAVLTPSDPEVGYLHRQRAYMWRRGPDTIDVLAVRSASIYTQRHAQDRSRFVSTVPDAADTELTLPWDEDYGFARLSRVDGVWRILDDYQIGITGPAETMDHVVLAGPRTVMGLEPNVWEAQPNGGVPPYTYRWQVYYKRCPIGGGGVTSSFGQDLPCGWTNVGTGRTLTHALRYSSTHQPQLRVRVRDSEGGFIHHTIDVAVSPPDGSRTAGKADAAPALAAARAADAPVAYALHGAHPNPSRRGAVVRYDLPETASVRLAVYDVLGREVARLVEASEGAGRRRAVLPEGLPPGVFVVRMEAVGASGPFTEAVRFTIGG